ncbi:Uu.00g090040.m01.CDS01 [Anthostomella pinea]|uniref:Uu.00g090040.m01.CDS01 n=1 Tax=Anthostomella pinea TaxID=933095 RepID=A0AAI8YKD3_9PEZI|nr:Uu.00g090040.m01.CDS01 [Anthostomella pinea]
MMPSVLGANVSHITPHHYPTDTNLEELSRQLALSDSIRRIARGSNGQRPPGAMRVVKPKSASNSPQAMMARRRTLMNDGSSARRRQQQALDQVVFQQMQDTSCYTNYQEPVKRTNRPVSWHPSSHFQEPQMHIPASQADYSQYIMPAPVSYQPTDMYSGYQYFPPTPAAYSGHTSPASNFSPLSLPYMAPSQSQSVPQYVAANSWNSASQFAPQLFNTNASPGTTESYPSYADQASYDWDTFAPQGFNSCMAPPTPDEYQAVQQHVASVPPEESIPYQPLEEPEEEGEILVGMGLYDTPTKTETDPGLDNYRTTTSQLLDTTYRSGKGWKLEEAWEPPAIDESDGDEDVDGEEQDEKDRTSESPAPHPAWI